MDDRNYRFSAALVAAFAGLGVTEACISPGSRSTPLAMTLAAHPAVRDWSHHDERSSGFFALGVGKASHRPALAVCTSGTAAAELHPAVVEARYGRVPLVVITADRPSDLWESGAPQTIDQRNLFGSASLWSHDLDVPAPGDGAPGYAASLAARLVAEALAGPGPVHLNLRFREPLVPQTDMSFPPHSPAPEIDRGLPVLGDSVVSAVSAELSGRSGLLVAGPQEDPTLPASAAAFAAALGYPILADPLSQLRAGTHDRSMVVAGADLLASAGFLARTPPEVVVRIGALPTSKPLWQWLHAHPEIPQILIDPTGWRDPGATASKILHADPADTLGRLAAAAAEAAPPDWSERWRRADAIAGDALTDALSGYPAPTEPGVARATIEALRSGSLLYVASSMPVRDVDMVMPSMGRSVRLASNRGANGIDGFVSSSLGAAAVWPGPVVGLAGDLSVLHDLTALRTAAASGLDLTLVVVNNDGGGIFGFLPQAGYHDVFERHFGTPHGLDFVRAAELFGVAAGRAGSIARLSELIAGGSAGPRLVEVVTDRAENVEVHAAIRETIASALR